MPNGPTFTIQDIAKHVENVNREVRGGAEPKAAFIKYATENCMPPGLLDATVKGWNKYRALNFMSKAANRGETFLVLNGDDVVAEYGKGAIKASASAAVKGDGAGGIRMTKSANTQAQPLEAEWAYQPVAQDPPRMKRAATAGELIEDEMKIKRAHTELVGLTYTTVSEMTKLATDAARMIHREPGRLLVLEEALWHDHGRNKVATYCDHIAELCAAQGVTVPRAKKARKHLISDLALLEKLAGMETCDETLAHCFETGLQLEEHMPKEANATTTAPSPTTTQQTHQGGGGNGGDTKADKGGKNKSESPAHSPDVSISLSGATLPPAPSTTGILGSLIQHSGVLPGSNGRQRAMDGLLEDHARAATLSRLMVTDPVIADAEPDEVMDAYQSILQHAPQLAKDHHAMRSALREALQYRSMPLSTVKELAGVAKTQADTASTVSDNSRNRYGI